MKIVRPVPLRVTNHQKCLLLYLQSVNTTILVPEVFAGEDYNKVNKHLFQNVQLMLYCQVMLMSGYIEVLDVHF